MLRDALSALPEKRLRPAGHAALNWQAHIAVRRVCGGHYPLEGHYLLAKECLSALALACATRVKSTVQMKRLQQTPMVRSPRAAAVTVVWV